MNPFINYLPGVWGKIRKRISDKLNKSFSSPNVNGPVEKTAVVDKRHIRIILRPYFVNVRN